MWERLVELAPGGGEYLPTVIGKYLVLGPRLSELKRFAIILFFLRFSKVMPSLCLLHIACLNLPATNLKTQAPQSLTKVIMRKKFNWYTFLSQPKLYQNVGLLV